MPASNENHAVKTIPLANLIVFAVLNLRRHLLRAVTNLLGIAVSVAAVVFFLSFYRGTYEGVMFSSVIDYATAQGQFASLGFDDDDPDVWLDPANLFDASIVKDRGILRSRNAKDAVRSPGLAPRLMCPAFAGDGSRKAPVTLVGVDFAAESEVLAVDERLVAGIFGGSGVVIGRKLAEILSLSVGDEIRIQATTVDGASNLDYWQVSAIFSTAYPPMDRGIVMMDLSQAQEFLASGDRINKVYARVASGIDSVARERAIAELETDAERKRVAGLGLFFRDWKNYAKAIVKDARMDRTFYGIFIFILLFLSLSTIAGTMRMTVFERKREIGMLRASGWLRAEIAGMFLFEALMIGIAGAAVGCLGGGALSLALQMNPLEFGESMANLDIPRFWLTCDLQPVDFLISAIAGFVTAIIAGIAPALSAARMPILTALAER